MASVGSDDRFSPRSRTVVIFLIFLAGAYAGFLISKTCFSVGGSDSSGYANTAKRMLAGTLISRPRALDRLGLIDDQAETFTPLGFVPGPRPGTIAPFYPPGFPVHLALAAKLFGWERAPFLVSPIAAVLCVLLFYAIARELGLEQTWALAGAVLFAAWPVLIGQAIQPMSDTVGTLWSMCSIYFAWRSRRRTAWSLAAGAAFGLAVLVRPTNALLAVPLAFALPWTVKAVGAFVAGGVPFAAALAAYNSRCYGSAFRVGYGKIGLLDAFALSNFPVRSRYYGGWILRTLTPLLPAGWLAVAAAKTAALRVRLLLLSWFGVFFLFHCFYEPYDSFFFVRFLLPGAPALFLGALLASRWLLAPLRPRIAARVAVLLFIVVLATEVRSAPNTGIVQLAEYESAYPQACWWAEATVPEGAIVLSMATSGALEYYTGIEYARWDWLDPAGFAALRERPETRGVRWFALLFPFEAERLRDHAPGNWKTIGTRRNVGLYELEAGGKR